MRKGWDRGEVVGEQGKGIVMDKVLIGYVSR